ncbi:MAG: hypothetical protein D5R99_01735 [Methanocalculus sp. MSAO_Arc1]|uniref:hypothetical protein n=1 Tax=Methanocalculus TaxID=71151 RepID=UPI000FF045A1|nr:MULTISPECIES: hypothetical protein [unclassified Methanocalculus]MCP1663125.1 hypothetical protein [Methanocalculus sp. AMF5]RQD81587.1 MAG: hypothetical protein D5R99_01735 [Methanocalculus sp. MSAO_Arc1]
MTILTTSRRPTQEIRTFAKDLAFALGCEHINRGKAGLRDLESRDPVFIFLEKQQNEVILRLEVEGDTLGEIRLAAWTISHRVGEMRRGIFVSDQSVYDLLKKYVPVTLVMDQEEGISFDGRQRRLYGCDLRR